MVRDDPPEPISVEINNNQRHLAIDAEALVRLVRHTLVEEGIPRASISIALVDNALIHDVNREYLEHDWPTDVVSFPLSEPEDAELAGELVVSTEMAATTARDAGVDPRAELALYVVHGLLHLCGYDDQSVEDKDAMRRRESELLAREGIINTFSLVGPDEAVDGERESARWSV